MFRYLHARKSQLKITPEKFCAFIILISTLTDKFSSIFLPSTNFVYQSRLPTWNTELTRIGVEIEIVEALKFSVWNLWLCIAGFLSYDLTVVGFSVMTFQHRGTELKHFLCCEKRDGRRGHSFVLNPSWFIQHIQIHDFIVNWKGVTVRFLHVHTFRWFIGIFFCISLVTLPGEGGGSWLMPRTVTRGRGVKVAYIASRDLWTSSRLFFTIFTLKIKWKKQIELQHFYPQLSTPQKGVEKCYYRQNFLEIVFVAPCEKNVCTKKKGG